MKYNIDIDSTIGWPYSARYIKSLMAKYHGKPCAVRINSLGGSVPDALDIRQQFLDHGDVTVYIFGMTASAATVIAMGAKKVCMSRQALMLIHPSSTFVFEWAQMNKEDLARLIADLQRDKDTLEKVDEVLCDLYAKRAGKTADEIRKVLVDAKWLTAEQCKELGLIDEILEEGSAPAVTGEVRNFFAASGYPVPELVDSSVLIERGKAVLENVPDSVPAADGASASEESSAEETNATTSNTPITMKKLVFALICSLLAVDDLEEKDGVVALTSEQLQQVEDRLKALSDSEKGLKAQVETLQSEVENLKKGDGAESPGVSGDGEKSADAYAGAKEMFNLVKDLI